MIGIYLIKSKIKPDRIYVGSAIDIKRRWYVHKYDLKNKKHSSIKLQRHYNKYGFDDLEFEIFDLCDINYLINNEQFYINIFNPYFNYNKIAGSQLGYKHRQETKDKMSKSRLGYKHRPETIEKLKGRIPANKGKHISEETRIKMKRKIPWNKGLKDIYTEETKDKMSKKGKLRVGNNNPFYKKHHSEETKEKIRKFQLENPSMKFGMKYKTTECPHCGKIGGTNTMKRWHFDKCKNKLQMSA